MDVCKNGKTKIKCITYLFWTGNKFLKFYFLRLN